jgi:hypothetical protein
MKNKLLRLTSAAMVTAVSLGACGGPGIIEGEDPNDPNNPTIEDPIRDSLEALGVSVHDDPRVDDEGNVLPEDWTPIGGTVEFGKTSELMLMGAQLQGGSASTTSVTFFEGDQSNAGVLHRTDGPAWIDESNSREEFAQTTRAAATGDINGDGREETVMVFVDVDDPDTNQELRVHTFNNQEASDPFGEAEQVIKIVPNVKDINVAVGDINGDGADDLVVGLSNGSQASLHFFHNDNGVFVEDTNAQHNYQPTLTDPGRLDMSLRIVTGNLDYDRAMETAVVFNEYVDSTGGTVSDSGASRYFVYDDASTSYAELDSGLVIINDGGNYVASVADVAIGDLDGDTLGEVVLGGLAGYVHSECNTQNMVGLVLDDAKHQLAPMAQHQWDYYPSCEAYDPLELRFAEVNTLDINADFVDEFSIHGFVFDSLEENRTFSELAQLPDSAFVDGSGGFLDRSTMTVQAGDFSGDGNDDLAVFSQQEGIRIYGPSHLDGRWGFHKHIATQFENFQNPLHAILLPVNLDNDTMLLRYASEYEFVFTAPVIVAAMAAPPCIEGIGQNTVDCRTSFGSATSSGSESESSFSVSGSVTTGFSVDGGFITQSEASVKATVSATATAMTGSAYSLTKSVEYTSGPQEDTVIFTTVPFDQYTYEILSHPDPEMIGREIVISQPRTPITLMVEREFYNSVIPEGSPRVEANVFEHTVGDIDTYPSRADKNSLINRYSGLEGNTQSVGQGNGFVTNSIAVGEEFSAGRSLAMDFSLDVEATVGGVVGGFSVGFGAENSLSISSGSETSYTGSVGQLPADQLGSTYNYGLFTYVQEDPATGQQFEVINYWVE